MKHYFLIIFIFLLCGDATCQKKDTNDKLSGTYIFDNFVDIKANGCCGEKWTLKLYNNLTFDLLVEQNQGDYEYKNKSWGIFNLRHDTLSLISFIPDSLGVLVPNKEIISDSLFKLSFPKFKGCNNNIYDIDRYWFYSIDSNLRQSKIDWYYTIPDYSKLMAYTKSNHFFNTNIKNPSIDSISFIFKRKNIDKYLLICQKINMSDEEAIKKNISNIQNSLSIRLSDYTGNNYYINQEIFFYKGFSDYSTYKFLVRKDSLITTLKYWNNATEYIYKRFKKNKKNEP